jgi:HSP20 family protein
MMNLMRYEPRYRPARSLGLLSRLLQDQELEGLLNPVVTNDNEPELVTDWLPAVDIQEEDDRFAVSADLPGADPEKRR